MTTDVTTATLPGSRDDVIDTLMKGEITSLPVVKNGQYRGLVSRDDILENSDEDQLAMLMRDVPTVQSEATIDECARVMIDNEERRIPVVSDSTLEGIITVTDMIEYIAELDNDEDVGEYAGREILTVWEETPLNVTVHVLVHAGETAACVLDDSGKVTGIITEIDCIRTAETGTSSKNVGEGVANQDDKWMWEGIKATTSPLISVSTMTYPEEPVSEFMEDDIVTVVRSTDVSDAAQHMLDHAIEQIPLTRGDDLIGILKDIELVETLVESEGE